MDYKYLKAFMLTARFQSFSKAAIELRIAQSAVSRQVRMLEESLGQQLIIRSSKQMILTPKGHDLFIALSDFDMNINTLFSDKRRQIIRVGILHGVLETWLIDFIRKNFSTAELNLTIQVDRPALLLEGLASRNFDFVLTNENIQNEMISSLKLFDEELTIISKTKIDFKKIGEYCWITYDKEDWLHRVYKKVKTEKFIQVNSMTAIVSMVQSGLGIAIVPTHVLGNETLLMRNSVPLLKNPSIYLSTLNYAILPRHLRPVVDLLRSNAALT